MLIKRNLVFYENIDEVFDNTDAVIVLTEWDEYKLRWDKLLNLMRSPKNIFDTRSIADEKNLRI